MMENKLTKIIQYLKKEFGAKAIILCGSRAVGDFGPESDWDMFVFTTKLKLGQDRLNINKKFGYPEIDGEDLDVYFIPLNTTFDWNIFGKKLRYSKVILDTPNKIAKKVTNAAQKVYDKGPQVSKERVMLNKKKSIRYNKKFDYLLKSKDSNRLFLYLGFYFDYVYNWWFEMRDKWPMRPQQGYSYIKKEDPNFYRQLTRISSDTPLKIKTDAAKRIHKLLF